MASRRHCCCRNHIYLENQSCAPTAYLAALLRLLSEAESAGLVGPADVEVVEEEDDEGPPGDFRTPDAADYDETGQGLSMGRPSAPWWDLVEPQLAQALLDR